MDLIFGLPAHPFAVHAPIVLLPIAAILTLVLAVRADWRDRLGWWLTGGLFVLVVMLFSARASGEALSEAFADAVDVGDHQTLGDQTFIITIVWFVAFAGLAFRDRQLRTAPSPQPLSAGVVDIRRDPIAIALTVVVSILAIVATVWLIRTGHSGAESHWAPSVRFFEE